MSIQTAFIRNLLYAQMATVLFLLQPYLTSIRMWAIRKYTFMMQTTVLKHTIIGMHVMLGVMLVDSTYRWNSSSSELLLFQNEKNFYLCLFCLFLSVVLNKLCALLKEAFKAELLNKKRENESKNSSVFIKSIISENEALKKLHNQNNKKGQKLTSEIDSNESDNSIEIIQSDDSIEPIHSDDSNDSNNSTPNKSNVSTPGGSDAKEMRKRNSFTFMKNK